MQGNPRVPERLKTNNLGNKEVLKKCWLEVEPTAQSFFQKQSFVIAAKTTQK